MTNQLVYDVSTTDHSSMLSAYILTIGSILIVMLLTWSGWKLFREWKHPKEQPAHPPKRSYRTRVLGLCGAVLFVGYRGYADAVSVNADLHSVHLHKHLLANHSYVSYDGVLVVNFVDNIVRLSHGSNERDTLFVDGIKFDVRCAGNPARRPLGAPGGCIPVDAGSKVRILYAPNAGSSGDNVLLRMWKLPSDD